MCFNSIICVPSVGAKSRYRVAAVFSLKDIAVEVRDLSEDKNNLTAALRMSGCREGPSCTEKGSFRRGEQ
jgi:hypothetical protein